MLLTTPGRSSFEAACKRLIASAMSGAEAPLDDLLTVAVLTVSPEPRPIRQSYAPNHIKTGFVTRSDVQSDSTKVVRSYRKCHDQP
jgi:hypothetical protein